MFVANSFTLEQIVECLFEHLQKSLRGYEHTKHSSGEFSSLERQPRPMTTLQAEPRRWQRNQPQQSRSMPRVEDQSRISAGSIHS